MTIVIKDHGNSITIAEYNKQIAVVRDYWRHFIARISKRELSIVQGY